MPEFEFYQTFYDKELLTHLIIELEKAGLKFKLDNKSGPTNFRAPISTYIEVDLLLMPEDFKKVDDIIS